jgi:hypothetical protein
VLGIMQYQVLICTNSQFIRKSIHKCTCGLWKLAFSLKKRKIFRTATWVYGLNRQSHKAQTLQKQSGPIMYLQVYSAAPQLFSCKENAKIIKQTFQYSCDMKQKETIALFVACFMLVSCWDSLQPRRWRWRQHVPPKYQLTFNGLYGVIFHKTELSNI